ncbi:MAG: hypothetical protein AAGF20_07425 [Pseudomonadota bacterium]
MMKRARMSSLKTMALAATVIGLSLGALAQSVPVPLSDDIQQARVTLDPQTVALQQSCLARMSGFPTDDPAARYQFFVLTETVGMDVDAATLSAMKHFGQPPLPGDVAMVEVIEAIANPVMLQARPSATVAQTVSLIEFAQECAPYIRGQIDSLAFIEPTFADPTFNVTIREDALYLRQMAGDALARLGAHSDPIYGPAVQTYDAALLGLRNEIEYTAFETELVDLEALYLTDLDDKLAIANDQINQEMDREVLSSSVAISNDMSEASDEERKRRMMQTLFHILNRY